MRPKLLIIDDEAYIRSLLMETFAADGFESRAAENGDEGLALCETFQPSVVLSDLKMPGKSGLDAMLRIVKSRFPELSVIIMTGYGTEDMAIEALRLGASNYLKKPFELNELRRIVADELRYVESAASDQPPLTWLREEELHFELENKLEQIARVVRHLFRRVQICVPGLGLDELELAVRELLVNALEHGNLELSSEEKHNFLEQGLYEKELESRAKRAPFRNRKLRLSYYRNGERILFRIRDEGPGFDWRSLPDPRGSQSAMKPSGRGIFLARTFGDQLHFNDEGNEVTLTKRLAAVQARERTP